MAAFCASRVAVPVVSAKGGVVSKQVRAGSGASVVRGLSVDKATCHRPSVAIFRLRRPGPRDRRIADDAPRRFTPRVPPRHPR